MSTGKTWRAQLIGSIACGLLVTGCARQPESAEEQRQPTANHGQPEKPAGATVALSGCVEPAPGARQYVLRNVRLEQRESGDPHIDTTTAAAHGITEGAWVRVRSEQDLAAHAGHRVAIVGSISDDGRNTIGTAGTSGNPVNSGDRSRAAAREHFSTKVDEEAGRIARESMANGTAAEVLAQKVETTGEKCPLEVSPESRR